MQRAALLTLVNLAMAMYGLYHFYTAQLATRHRGTAQLEAPREMDGFYLPYCVCFVTLVLVRTLAYSEIEGGALLHALSGAAFYALFCAVLLYSVSHYFIAMATHSIVFFAALSGVLLSGPLHQFQQRVAAQTGQ